MKRRPLAAERVRGWLAKLGGGRVVAAVSGGADSMALLDILCRLDAAPAAVAHVDYRLRGRASTADRAAVESACAERGVPLQVRRLTDTEVRRLKESGLQEKARELRYTFFEQVRAATGAAWIALAHTRDDQVETFFFNLFRGAGPGGLAAMRPLEPERRLFRPLLETSRRELVEYLVRARVRWREDASNREPVYTRNRIRNELVPLIARAFGGSGLDGVFRATRVLEAEDRLLDELTGRREELLVPVAGGGLELSCDALLSEPLALARRLVRRAALRISPESGRSMSLAFTDAILELAARSEPGKALMLAGLSVRKQRGKLVFGPLGEGAQSVRAAARDRAGRRVR